MTATSAYRKVATRASSPRGDRIAALIVVAYVHLWIFEGALRKWVPGLDQPMYVARDAFLIVALLALMLFRAPVRPQFSLAFLALIAFTAWLLLSAIASGAPPFVSLLGVRSYVAPLLLPLLVIGYVERSVVWHIATAIVTWAPVEALLAIGQSGSGPDARINVSLSDAPAGLVDFGVVRSTGTFTSPSGLTGWVIIALAASLALTFGDGARRWRKLGVLGIASSVVVVALGSSRGAVLGAAVVVVIFLVVAISQGGRKAAKAVTLTIGLTLVGYLALTAFFPDRLSAFAQRFANAANTEDPGTRLIAQLSRFPDYFVGVLGAGPGIHSQAGIAAGSQADWIEDDSTKWVAELGLIGVVLAVARVALIAYALLIPVLRARSIKTERALFLAALAGTQLVGQVTQTPSSQAAFGVIVAALVTIKLGAEPATPVPSPSQPAVHRSALRKAAPAAQRSLSHMNRQPHD